MGRGTPLPAAVADELLLLARAFARRASEFHPQPDDGKRRQPTASNHRTVVIVVSR
ncbi:MAG: hypothetical protein LBH84_00800 [Prevotellaceae bacterium]|nr:hypothetical protein [Prevotellaceae bacterium]